MACRQDDAAEHMHTASVMRATASMAGPSGTPDRYKDLDGNDELLVFVEPQPEDVYMSGISLYDSTILRDLKDGKVVIARSGRGLGKSSAVVVGRCPGCPVAQSFNSLICLPLTCCIKFSRPAMAESLTII